MPLPMPIPTHVLTHDITSVWAGDAFTSLTFAFIRPLHYGVISKASVSIIFSNGSVEYRPLELVSSDVGETSQSIFKKKVVLPWFGLKTTCQKASMKRLELFPGSSITDNSQHTLEVELCQRNYPDGTESFKVELILNFSEIEKTFCENDVIFRSQEVRVNYMKLCIQLLELSEDIALPGESSDEHDNVIDWFGCQGGRNRTIDVMIHLKDVEGRFVEDYPCDLLIHTELIYEDGSTIPLVKTLRTGRSQASSSSTAYQKKMKFVQDIYTPMRDGPTMKCGSGSQFFAFRINDLSVNHFDRGFKLKVSPAGSINNIFPGTMDEVIVSKSKTKDKFGGQQGGRTSFLQKVCGAAPVMLTNKGVKVPCEGLKSSTDHDNLDVLTNINTEKKESFGTDIDTTTLSSPSISVVLPSFQDDSLLKPSEVILMDDSISNVCESPKKIQVNAGDSSLIHKLKKDPPTFGNLGAFVFPADHAHGKPPVHDEIDIPHSRPPHGKNFIKPDLVTSSATFLPPLAILQSTPDNATDHFNANAIRNDISVGKCDDITGNIKERSTDTGESMRGGNNNIIFDEMNQTVQVPEHQILRLFAGNSDKCFGCGAKLVTGMNTEEHNDNCRLSFTLAPIVAEANIKAGLGTKHISGTYRTGRGK